MSFFTAKNLRKTFGKVTVLNDLSLQLQRGKVFGLLGNNGAGKSTTLQILSGAMQATAGELKLDGTDFVDDPITYKNAIGYLPDTPPLYSEMRVLDYLRLIAKLRQLAPTRATQQVDFVLQACALETVTQSKIHTLSKGYQQRVSIAQAIMHQPKLIILDEPTTGLDPEQLQAMQRLMKQLREYSSIIFSSHIMQEIDALCDEVWLLENGQLKQPASALPLDEN